MHALGYTHARMYAHAYIHTHAHTCTHTRTTYSLCVDCLASCPTSTEPFDQYWHRAALLTRIRFKKILHRLVETLSASEGVCLCDTGAVWSVDNLTYLWLDPGMRMCEVLSMLARVTRRVCIFQSYRNLTFLHSHACLAMVECHRKFMRHMYYT